MCHYHRCAARSWWNRVPSCAGGRSMCYIVFFMEWKWILSVRFVSYEPVRAVLMVQQDHFSSILLCFKLNGYSFHHRSFQLKSVLTVAITACFSQNEPGQTIITVGVTLFHAQQCASCDSKPRMEFPGIHSTIRFTVAPFLTQRQCTRSQRSRIDMFNAILSKTNTSSQRSWS